MSQAKDAVKHGQGSATVSMTPNARSPERLGLNFPAPRGFCVPLRTRRHPPEIPLEMQSEKPDLNQHA